jgi:HAD superfamily hydrolase (TIGR01509 family)
MTYDAVIFDMGDIFYDATLWRKGLVVFLQQRGIDIDFPTLRDQWEAKLVAVYLAKRPYWEAFEEFLHDMGLDDAGVAEGIAFALAKAKEVRQTPLYPQVADTLKTLHDGGVKLAVLSDTESPEAKVRARLTEFEINEYFDVVLTSVDIGHVKPEAEAFQRALNALGVTKERACFVAHDDDELTGALAFGITAVAFNFEPGVPADHYLDEFGQLTPLVLGA